MTGTAGSLKLRAGKGEVDDPSPPLICARNKSCFQDTIVPYAGLSHRQERYSPHVQGPMQIVCLLLWRSLSSLLPGDLESTFGDVGYAKLEENWYKESMFAAINTSEQVSFP